MWKHKTKYKGRLYAGKYERTKSGDREFQLVFILRNGKRHEISFESWQAAQVAGWVKQ